MSRLEKASSKSNSDGRVMRARARARRCCSPPESFGFALRFVFQTDVAQGLHGLFFDFGFGQTAHFEAEADVVEGG